MLHGLLGGPENWKTTIPYLPQTFEPVALRLPFFDNENSLNSVIAVVDYVQNCLNDMGVDRVVLMGNSLGGHIALLLSVQIPERVCGLVLTGSSGLFERSFSKIPGVRPAREWVYGKCCEVFHDICHVTDVLVDSVMEVICDRRKARILVQLAKSAKRDNIADKLKQITCPTLLVWGKQDQVTPSEVAEEFHSKITNSVLVWLDKCGHTPMTEHPVEFSHEVACWWMRTLIDLSVHEEKKQTNHGAGLGVRNRCRGRDGSGGRPRLDR